MMRDGQNNGTGESTRSGYGISRAAAIGLAFFGLTCSGSASADLAERIAACPAAGCVIQLEHGQRYVETRPWNLRNKKDVTIRGDGQTVYFNLPLADTPPLVIDATGAVGLHFEGWQLALANSSGKPEAGLLLARNTTQDMAGMHRFDRWKIMGWFSKAAVVSMASEMNVWLQCHIQNSHPDGVTFWTGRDNALGMNSPFGEFGTGSTNTCGDFIATGFGNYGAAHADSPNGVTIVVAGGTHDFHFRGGTMSMPYRRTPGEAGGYAAIRIGTPGGKPVYNLVLDAVEWETTGASHAVAVTGMVNGLSARGCLFQSVGEAIYVEKSGALNDSVIEYNRILVRYGVPEGSPPLDAVAAILGSMTGTRLDLSGSTLVPLTGDGGVRAKRAIVVVGEPLVRDNEFLVRDLDDIVGPKSIHDDNHVRARRNE